jgi:hypothetical protein
LSYLQGKNYKAHKKEKKRESARTKQRHGTDFVIIKFKITMIDILRLTIKKVDSMLEKMSYIRRDKRTRKKK